MSAWSRWLELDGEVQVVVRSGIGAENITLLHLTWNKQTFKEAVQYFGQRNSFEGYSQKGNSIFVYE